MLRKFFALFILISLTCPVFAAPAATTTKDGLKFEIGSTAINTVGNSKYLAIEFRFYNQTAARKIDMSGGFQYALADNFTNRYRQLQKPDDYTKQTEHLPPNFPSVYPGEFCSTTLFFEAPVPKAETLELLITSASLGIVKPLSVPFSIAAINLSGSPETLAATINIATPENGAVFEKGIVFPLNIILKADQLPNKLIVIAFGKTFEDTTPVENNTYNIAIPVDAPAGQASINVIGRWNTPFDENQIASKNIVIFVKGDSPLTAL